MHRMFPEYSTFEHIARVPWPQTHPYQEDWIDCYATLEQWLCQRIGPHHSQWAWAQEQEQQHWEACVAFRWAKHKTLFLLTWA
jgi:hypothetical protein